MNQYRPFHPVQQLHRVLSGVPGHYYAWWHTQAAGVVGTSETAVETKMVAVLMSTNTAPGRASAGSSCNNSTTA